MPTLFFTSADALMHFVAASVTDSSCTKLSILPASCRDIAKTPLISFNHSPAKLKCKTSNKARIDMYHVMSWQIFGGKLCRPRVAEHSPGSCKPGWTHRCIQAIISFLKRNSLPNCRFVGKFLEILLYYPLQCRCSACTCCSFTADSSWQLACTTRGFLISCGTWSARNILSCEH